MALSMTFVKSLTSVIPAIAVPFVTRIASVSVDVMVHLTWMPYVAQRGYASAFTAAGGGIKVAIYAWDAEPQGVHANLYRAKCLFSLKLMRRARYALSAIPVCIALFHNFVIWKQIGPASPGGFSGRSSPGNCKRPDARPLAP
ncbi:hypothetical protein [Roseovarius sp. D0-M9]|uniref:hypothetical protein n=1 Tax=Roseovarius sp. D0-M9 TaxID=3127117 RepID=UPI00300F8A57